MTSLAVSVIIPAYRAAPTIGRALDSLLAQTRPPDEVLVVDDGSPDDLAGALGPYGDRVRLIRQPNGGAASARNRGIAHAAGDLIAFLDADDYWEADKLRRQLDLLGRHPEVGLVAGRFYTQPPGHGRRQPSADPLPWCGRVLRPGGGDPLALASRITTSTVLVRRGVLEGRRFDPGLGTAEDVDLWVRLVAATPVYLMAEPLVTLVLEAGSLSRSDVAADSRNMLAVVRRYAGLVGRAGQRAWRALVFRNWAAGHLGEGDGRSALWPAWLRVVHEPWSVEGWWVLVRVPRGGVAPAAR
jgi:glycosyltransferase involved in cell wall biosynthesis